MEHERLVVIVPEGLTFGPHTYSDCEIGGALFSSGEDSERLAQISNLSFVNCSMWGTYFTRCLLAGVKFERVKCRGHGVTFQHCVFDRVSLGCRGPVAVKQWHYEQAPGGAGRRAAYTNKVDRLYDTISWALDVRRLSSGRAMQFAGVPPAKIIVDPERQVIVDTRVDDHIAAALGIQKLLVCIEWGRSVGKSFLLLDYGSLGVDLKSAPSVMADIRAARLAVSTHDGVSLP